jgi:hypothetical protein
VIDHDKFYTFCPHNLGQPRIFAMRGSMKKIHLIQTTPLFVIPLAPCLAIRGRLAPTVNTWRLAAAASMNAELFRGHFRSRDAVGYLLEGDVTRVIGTAVIGLVVNAEGRETTIVR